jgi:CRP/FNR family transcriptional regulator, cyclic AMP receptor protein
MTPDKALPVIEATFGCTASLAKVIGDRAVFRHYRPRQAIIAGGEALGHAFLIIDGRAKEIALALDGRTVLVQEFGRGDLFGEGVILGNQIATEDVIAIDLTEAGLFSAANLIGLIENYSNVALAVSRLLTHRLMQTRRRVVEGATLSASGRVHAELLRQGKAAPGYRIQPAPVLTEFAQKVQSTRETVSRTISQLEKRGIIKRDGHGLTIVAPHRLEELVV